MRQHALYGSIGDVREVGEFVQGIDGVFPLCEAFVDAPGVGHDKGTFAGVDEPAVFRKQFLRAATFAILVVPDDLEQTKRSLGVAKRVGDDGDPFIDWDDSLHARLCERSCIVQRDHARAESRRMKNDRREHTRETDIDRVWSLAQYFCRRVDAEAAFLSDKLECGGGFWFDTIRYRLSSPRARQRQHRLCFCRSGARERPRPSRSRADGTCQISEAAATRRARALAAIWRYRSQKLRVPDEAPVI